MHQWFHSIIFFFSCVSLCLAFLYLEFFSFFVVIIIVFFSLILSLSWTCVCVCIPRNSNQRLPFVFSIASYSHSPSRHNATKNQCTVIYVCIYVRNAYFPFIPFICTSNTRIYVLRFDINHTFLVHNFILLSFFCASWIVVIFICRKWH